MRNIAAARLTVLLSLPVVLVAQPETEEEEEEAPEAKAAPVDFLAGVYPTEEEAPPSIWQRLRGLIGQ